MLKIYWTIFFLTLGVFTPPAYAQRGSNAPPSVFVENVQSREFSLNIEALGTLEPNEKVDLTLNVADRVTAIFFDDGQRIEEGKTLLSLAQREQVALVEAAEATLDEATTQLDRVMRLSKENAIAQSEVDQARRDRDNASAQLRAVQSRQKDRVLVAPFDGVLGFRMVSVGTYVRAGDVVATLIDDSEMKLEFAVPSTFLRSLKQGTPISAYTSDLPGETFNGMIATIDNAIDPITRSIKVRAILPNPDQVLKSGMFMQVTLKTTPRNSPSIPEEAVQSVGPDTFVYVINDINGKKIATRKQVQLGARQSKYVEIISGVETGDVVITEGIMRVREGSEVSITDPSSIMPEVFEENTRLAASGSSPAGK
ncbi:efflux RND transporter periplasmic adaptor subunit [Hirschia baltica]|uniref:Efflux transporter, RND family, MFP subunit n=1 Tax=Hirschia baltica (strain ATCC 49814 / DSM 5838 / IFAM 1418) TaxID=582402 RepID=C6XS22_HIRBI|nr:efflux RND transporter periplasmic adaptor subunit [Hirschia baltica]ACT60863.1 efflux transporter, RND family, MFP subunit [Hirschia baltica ATCC 49814]